MKGILIFSSMILMLLSFETYASPTLSECSSCTYQQRKALVIAKAGIEPLSIHYVIDFNNEYLHYYKVQVNEEIGTSTVTTLTLSSGVASSINAYWQSRSAADAYFTSHPNALSYALSSSQAVGIDQSPVVNGGFNAFGSAAPTSATGSCKDNPDGITAYLSDSSYRKSHYDTIHTLYPVAATLRDTWNNFATAANLSLGFSKTIFSVDIALNAYIRPLPVRFTDGSHAKVVVGPSGDTYQVVKGTAYDCNDNKIPESAEEFRGVFEFQNEMSAEQFKKYGELFDIQFNGVGNISQCTLQSRCVTNGDKYECTFSCM